MKDTFKIRTATPEDVCTAIEWAAGEGWNPGLADANCFHAADPEGFMVGEIDGRVVATISAVKYENHYGFVGLYIVHPDFRGQGFGLSIWNHALAPLKMRNLGLDAVIAQTGNYARMGFVAAHRTIRHRAEGRPPNAAPAKPIPDAILRALIAFDRRFFAARREAFLQAWLTQAGAKVAWKGDPRAIHAYGVMRPCREGWKIGPLFACSRAAAESVLGELLDHTAGAPAFLDVPETNPAGIGLARSLQMTPTFETTRMYTRGQPAGIDPSGIYGMTSLELG